MKNSQEAAGSTQNQVQDENVKKIEHIFSSLYPNEEYPHVISGKYIKANTGTLKKLDRELLNKKMFNGVHQGKTLLWALASTKEGLDILYTNPQLLEHADYSVFFNNTNPLFEDFFVPYRKITVLELLLQDERFQKEILLNDVAAIKQASSLLMQDKKSSLYVLKKLLKKGDPSLFAKQCLYYAVLSKISLAKLKKVHQSDLTEAECSLLDEIQSHIFNIIYSFNEGLDKGIKESKSSFLPKNIEIFLRTTNLKEQESLLKPLAENNVLYNLYHKNYFRKEKLLHPRFRLIMSIFNKLSPTPEVVCRLALMSKTDENSMKQRNFRKETLVLQKSDKNEFYCVGIWDPRKKKWKMESNALNLNENAKLQLKHIIFKKKCEIDGWASPIYPQDIENLPPVFAQYLKKTFKTFSKNKNNIKNKEFKSQKIRRNTRQAFFDALQSVACSQPLFPEGMPPKSLRKKIHSHLRTVYKKFAPQLDKLNAELQELTDRLKKLEDNKTSQEKNKSQEELQNKIQEELQNKSQEELQEEIQNKSQEELQKEIQEEIQKKIQEADKILTQNKKNIEEAIARAFSSWFKNNGAKNLKARFFSESNFPRHIQNFYHKIQEINEELKKNSLQKPSFVLYLEDLLRALSYQPNCNKNSRLVTAKMFTEFADTYLQYLKSLDMELKDKKFSNVDVENFQKSLSTGYSTFDSSQKSSRSTRKQILQTLAFIASIALGISLLLGFFVFPIVGLGVLICSLLLVLPITLIKMSLILGKNNETFYKKDTVKKTVDNCLTAAKTEANSISNCLHSNLGDSYKSKQARLYLMKFPKNPKPLLTQENIKKLAEIGYQKMQKFFKDPSNLTQKDIDVLYSCRESNETWTLDDVKNYQKAVVPIFGDDGDLRKKTLEQAPGELFDSAKVAKQNAEKLLVLGIEYFPDFSTVNENKTAQNILDETYSAYVISLLLKMTLFFKEVSSENDGINKEALLNVVSDFNDKNQQGKKEAVQSNPISICNTYNTWFIQYQKNNGSNFEVNSQQSKKNVEQQVSPEKLYIDIENEFWIQYSQQQQQDNQKSSSWLDFFSGSLQGKRDPEQSSSQSQKINKQIDEQTFRKNFRSAIKNSSNSLK